MLLKLAAKDVKMEKIKNGAQDYMKVTEAQEQMQKLKQCRNQL